MLALIFTNVILLGFLAYHLAEEGAAVLRRRKFWAVLLLWGICLGVTLVSLQPDVVVVEKTETMARELP